VSDPSDTNDANDGGEEMEAGLELEIIESYFEEYGWTCDPLDESTLRTGFRGKNGTYTALVRVTEHWVVFTINPYLRPPESGWGKASLTALAAANQAVHMAKLGIDPDDDAFLTIELPTEGFAYEQFEEALTSLTAAADNFVVPLLQAQLIDERNG
jgi:hypothetical protein